MPSYANPEVISYIAFDTCRRRLHYHRNSLSFLLALFKINKSVCMKIKHYPPFVSIKLFVRLSVIALFAFGSAINAQTYTIDFSTHPPPATNDPTLDQNDHISPPFVPED